jgi:DMSO reductase anchor subunit
VHIHLLLNHIPVIGLIGSILILVYGMVRRSAEVQRVALIAFVLVAVIAIPVYRTGEPAEEAVERLPGVSHDRIEAHEEAAEPAFYATLATGVIALAALFVDRWKTLLARAVLIASIVAFALIARTANLGGEIRHQEIRGGTGAVQSDDDSDRRGRDATDK